MVVHTCNPNLKGGRRILSSRTGQAVSETLSQKQNTNQRAGGVAQVVEHLCSKALIRSLVW
jgi:hypothetical protein